MFRSKAASVRFAEVTNTAPLGGIRLEVRFSPMVKSSLLVRTVRSAIGESRAATGRPGLGLGSRLRPSLVAKQNADLKVDGEKLPRRGLGDLAEGLLGAFPADLGELTPEGRSLAATLKSRRAKVKSRLIRKGLLPEW
jgi:hypothetical protein